MPIGGAQYTHISSVLLEAPYTPLYLQLVQPSSAFLEGFTCVPSRPGFEPTSAFPSSNEKGTGGTQAGALLRTFRLTNTENAEGLLKNCPSNMISPAGPKSAGAQSLW